MNEMSFVIPLAIVLIVSIIASVQDIRRGMVNNFVLWTGAVLMIVFHAVFEGCGVWTYLMGGVFSFLVFLLARVLSKGKLGFADVYFALFAGVSLDWHFVWIFMLSACVFAGIYYALRIILYKKVDNLRIKFIPFLSLGLIFAFLAEVAGLCF